MISTPSFLKKLFSKKLAASNDPARDWFMVLAVSLAMLIVSVVWNVWFFGEVTKEKPLEVGEGADTLRTHETASVRELFEKREAAAKAYQETYVFVDPAR